MKRNFKYTKERRKTGIKAVIPMDSAISVTIYYGYKKKSTNRTTWSPERSLADVRKAKVKRFGVDRLKALGLLGYFGYEDQS